MTLRPLSWGDAADGLKLYYRFSTIISVTKKNNYKKE